jgi:hypothetical protein
MKTTKEDRERRGRRTRLYSELCEGITDYVFGDDDTGVMYTSQAVTFNATDLATLLDWCANRPASAARLANWVREQHRKADV